MTAIDPDLRTTRTTCPYCGVGCGVLATPDGSGGAAIAGDPEHPANFGRLCSKGSALGETLGLEERLLHPMIRCSKGNMERVAWSDALDHVANPESPQVSGDGGAYAGVGYDDHGRRLAGTVGDQARGLLEKNGHRASCAKGTETVTVSFGSNCSVL